MRAIQPLLCTLIMLAGTTVVAQQPIFPGIQSYIGDGTRGLVMEDFDGDGLLDIASANEFSGDVTVLLGEADTRFGAPTSHLIGMAFTGLAAADLDGDLDLDLVAVSSAFRTIIPILGNGDGTFVAPGAPFNQGPVGIAPTEIELADVTGDTVVDAIVVNGDNTVSILAGNGDGTFATAVDLSTGAGSGTSSVDVVDVNGDRVADLVVGNQSGGDLGLFLGTGGGLFSAMTSVDVSSRPADVVSGDVTGDGLLDLVVAGNNNNVVEVLAGDGAGNFAVPVTYPVDPLPVKVHLADLNGDGRLDVLAGTTTRHMLSVLLNDGLGGFVAAEHYYAKYRPYEIVTGDIDQDGFTDVVAGTYFNGVNGPSFAATLFGVGDGTLLAPETYDIVAAERVLMHGDFDEDGLPDLAVGHAVGLSCGILKGNGDGTYTQIGVYSLDGGAANDIDIADVNNDGHLDIATALRNLDACGVLLGNGDGTFQDNELYDVGINPRGVSIAHDLNGDGFRDLAGANKWNLPDMGSVTVRLNNGDGTFAAGTDYWSGSDTLYVIFEDIDGDEILDMTSCNLESYDITIRPGVGDGTFGAATFVSLHNGVVDGWPSRHYFEDLDDDGDRDMIAAGMQGEGLILCEANGDGTFQQAVHFPIGAVPEQSRFIVTADVDNDGDPDVLMPSDGLHSNGPARMSILLNEGNLNFAPEDAYAAGNRPYDIDLVDLDRDGWLDAACASYADSMVTVYLNQLSPYRDLGYALAGTGGIVPHCVGYGSLEEGTTVGFRLSRGLPGAVTFLAVGLNSLYIPLEGGTLVPDFQFIFTLPVNADGFSDALGPLPPGVPAGLELYGQFWVPDPGGPYGFAASNAVVGVVP